MDSAATQIAYLRDRRLSACAATASPAWLWSADGSRILWANAVGAAIFGGNDVAAATAKRFDPSQTAAAQILQLGRTLKHDAPPRLERLRGFGAGFGRLLLCACSRLSVGGQSAILIAAAEPAEPNLSFDERVRRLLPGAASDIALAAFARDGKLLHATASAATLLNDMRSLENAGLAEPAREALQTGHATGTIAGISIALERIGEGANAFLLATASDAARQGAADAHAHPAIASTDGTATMPAGERRQTGRVPVDARPAFEPRAQVHDDTQTRRHPLRFVWQMDAEGRFSLGAGEFTDLIGPSIAAGFGRPWREINAEYGLDPHDEVMRAIASRGTWSGISLGWPVEASDEPLAVELSGLPVYDRDRVFRGYRGFGVCRDIGRIEELAARLARGKAAPAPPERRSERNILPFRAEVDAPARKSPALTQGERSAFRELGSRLAARLRGADAVASAPPPPAAIAPQEGGPAPTETELAELAPALAPGREPEPLPSGSERPVLDRLPVGVLIYRHSQFLYANPAFLAWSGHATLAEFSGAGGLDALFIATHEETRDVRGQAGQSLRIARAHDDDRPAAARLYSVEFEGAGAMALILAAPAATAVQVQAETRETEELRSILDIAADGILVVDRNGTILQANAGAEDLFGRDDAALTGGNLFDLLTADGARVARDCLDWLARAGAPRTLSEGREVGAHPRLGDALTLSITLGRLGENAERFCAVLRNVTGWRRTQDDLMAAKRQAENASAAKSSFLAKVSHEIRTPLNAIIGFSEVMMDERFGPVGNERYRAYLRDIHASGEHLISLLNDLLDLSKIEAGKLELNFASLNLNDLIQQSVAIVQPQAVRERTIVRMSLGSNLPKIVADARSVRQIVLNLLTNAIKFTGPGGQVIVSTATERNGIVLRVRDNGPGMSEKDIETALEPFRQSSTASRSPAAGSGLGLPLTRALAEANKASFRIQSGTNAGTLVEIAFPPERMAAE